MNFRFSSARTRCMDVLVCKTACYPSCTDFTVSQLFNNEVHTFLRYSDMVRDTILSDSPVILNQIFDESAMFIVCASDWMSVLCFINSYGFSRFEITKFLRPFTVDLLTVSLPQTAMNLSKSHIFNS